MQVYQFKMWDRNFAIDVESGNFFEVDQAVSKAIILMKRYPKEEIIARLAGGFGRKYIGAITDDLLKLKRKDLLFSSKKPQDMNIKRRITDLTLNIVNTCNLRCSYCWNQAGAYGNLSKLSRKMGKAVAFKAVDLLVRESRGAKDLVVDFYGGEPLLNFELIKDVVNYCKDIQRKKKINFHFLLATNGTLLTKEIGEYLIRNGVDIAVSLDGSQKIQDIQRPFPDGKGSFDAILDNINSIRKDYRKKIVGRATFTPYSTKIIETFKFLRNLGFERIELCESEKAGYGLDLNSKFFFSGAKGLRRLKTIYHDLAIFYTREILKGNLTYANTYFNRFFKQLSRLYNIHSIAGACSAGFTLMAVDMDGSIYPCTAFVGMPEFKTGTVKTGVDNSRLKIFSDNKITSSKVCARCWAKKICRGCGSCYNLNYFSNKNIGKPDPYYCELFRYKTKLMIAMIAEIARKNAGLLDKVLIPEYYAARGKRKNK